MNKNLGAVATPRQEKPLEAADAMMSSQHVALTVVANVIVRRERHVLVSEKKGDVRWVFDQEHERTS